MIKDKWKYNFINIAVILSAAFLFFRNFSDFRSLFDGRNAGQIVVITATVCLVHLIKAGRLYLALYGSELDLLTYIKIYCKVTPVSVVFPFKSGEFFRMYCYGKQLENLLKGIVIVLLDRFMDTMALLTAILLVWIFNGGQITSFVYILLIFLVSAFLLYYVFPGVYRYWKLFLLRARATGHKLNMLKTLDVMNTIYQEITGVSRGRGIILYFMSLLAWAVEIGSLALLNGFSREAGLNRIITEYLSSAMGNGQSIELRQFVFISVALLAVIYLLIKIAETVIGKKEHSA